MDPAGLAAAVTRRTKAIIPVHLFGQPADLDPILDFARSKGLRVIEDAAQAHGAMYKGRPAGSIGDVGCFSFYPGKNLGAFGEAGGVVTDDAEIDEKIRILRDHGQARKYHHTMVGWNCRMDGIQAAVLRVKLRHLTRGNERRREHAAAYRRELAGTEGIVLPHEADYAEHVYHIFAVRVQDRDQVLQSLERRGIGCGIHYPVPVHLQRAYAGLGHQRGSYPISERTSAEFISLPMFPELTEEQIDRVVAAAKAVVPGAVLA
jgi:dTDP-4-amino-4,6-dideoxygalactose transaminase